MRMGSDVSAAVKTELRDIPIDLIDVSGFNVRKNLAAGTEESSLDDLAESIRQKGLLAPVTVRPKGSRFELIVGQRRYLACKKLGWDSIRAIVRADTSDTDSTELSLIENVHRAEMHPLDKARALRGLLETYGNDTDRVAKETGIGLPTVRKYLALMELPPEIQQRLSTLEGPAKVDALATLARTFENPNDMVAAYDQISGFTQPVQRAILNASGGDIGKVQVLTEQALAGAFDVRTCHGVQGMMVCQELDKLPLEFRTAVVEAIRTQAEDPERSFEQTVRDLTRSRTSR
jgi:ParB family chromosome partitioning protein